MRLIGAWRSRQCTSDVALLVILSGFCLASTPLFFEAVTCALAGRGEFWPIVLGDVLIFPTAYVANGIADGLQAAYATPGVWYSQENAVVVNNILQNTIGRFVGPPFARY